MRSPNERLLDVLSKSAGIHLNPADVEIQNVRVNDNPDIDRNTRCFLLARENGKLKGSVDFYYNRLDLGKLFYGTTPVLTQAYGSRVTTQQLAAQLGQQFGVELYAEDVEQSGEIYLTKFPYTLELKAQPGSYVVVGSLTIQLVDSGNNVGVVLGVSNLNGLNPPNGDFTKIQGCLYSWNWLTQPGLAEILRGLQVGNTVPATVAPFLSELDGTYTWVSDSNPAPANTSGAVLTYLGNRDNHPTYASGARRDEIAVIRLTESSTEVGGELVISLP